jgi:hypothetical protein
MLPSNKAVVKRYEILTKKMTWQQDSSPISHYASVQPVLPRATHYNNKARSHN